jgi:hypothetical protein
VFEDNATLTEGTEGSLSVGEWDHNAGNDRLYIRASGDDDPAGYAIEWSGEKSSISDNNQSYLVFDDITAYVPWNGVDEGMGFQLNAAHNTIQNCTVSGDKDESTEGIEILAADSDLLGNNISGCQYGIYCNTAAAITGLWDDNTIHTLDKGSADDSDGIKLTGGADCDGLVVSNNDISGFQEDGIDAFNVLNVVIESNYIHDNDTAYTVSEGIKLGANSSGVIIRYNKIKDVYRTGAGGEAGITCAGDDNEIYYNLIIGTGDGIRIFDGSTGCKVYNNVISGANNDGVHITDASVEATIQNNICDGAGDDFEINTAGGTITGGNNCLENDAAVVETAGTYNGSNDLGSTDPLYTNPGSADFTLQSGSPCIEAGVDVGLTQDYAGDAVPQGSVPDIGAYEWVGAGGLASISKAGWGWTSAAEG